MLPSSDGAEPEAAEELMIKKESLPAAVGDDDDDELRDDNDGDDEVVEAVQSQYEEDDDDEEEAAKPGAEEAEEEEEAKSEVAAAVPLKAASSAVLESEASGGAELRADGSGTAASCMALASAAGEEGDEVVVVKREAAMAAEHENEPIPQPRLHELEAKAMWADDEVVEKQFQASRWPGLDGVFWRLAHRISCEKRSISSNTKALPSGQIIVASIFVHVTTPQVCATTDTPPLTQHTWRDLRFVRLLWWAGGGGVAEGGGCAPHKGVDHPDTCATCAVGCELGGGSVRLPP